MMYKNLDYKDTYSSPEHANVRYPSEAIASIGGFAYVFTQDAEYVHHLAHYHLVEVKYRGAWCQYTGALPSVEEAQYPQEEPFLTYLDEDPSPEDIERLMKREFGEPE